VVFIFLLKSLTGPPIEELFGGKVSVWFTEKVQSKL